MKLIINTDGGARGNPGPAAIGVVISDGAKSLKNLKEYIGEATNNVAEYKALILALKTAASMGAQELLIRMDSELIVRQMQGRYKMKEPALKVLATEALSVIRSFKKVDFTHIRRELNKQADKLVNEAIDEAMDK